MSTFLCKNGVRKEYFLTPTFIIEPEKRLAEQEVFSKPFLMSWGKGVGCLLAFSQWTSVFFLFLIVKVFANDLDSTVISAHGAVFIRTLVLGIADGTGFLRIDGKFHLSFPV